MTRPLYEPTTARTDAYLDYQQQQLFRRPAPDMGSGIEVVHLFSWNYDTVNTVANTTWTSVCGLGGTDGFYEEVFYTPAFSTAWNCAAGTVGLPASAEYLIQGWVQFNEDAVAGEQRFVAINFGSSNRHIQEYVANANSLANLALHLPVHTFYLRTGTTTLFMEVWQDSGGNISIRGAELSVKLLVRYADGVDEAC